MSIMNKLKKNSRSPYTDVLSESKIFKNRMTVSTDVPMINVALSGNIKGGLTSGLKVFAGPSKHFKTMFALYLASFYLKENPEAALLFYDSEFGSPGSYFESMGIDPERVIHTPIADVEELKFDLVNQLEQLERSEKVIVVIDSIGNLASKKELEDAKNEKSVADMSRAKALKGLFRMVTPYLTMKDIPLIAINHTYQEMGLFPKAIVSGGTGIYYSADTIWIIGRRQTKTGTEVTGYDFVINIEKSRFVKEKSKIPISVTWAAGIEKYSGLLDVAVAAGYVHKGRKGRSLGFCPMNPETGEIFDEKMFYEKETVTKEFWDHIFATTDFETIIENQYSIGKQAVFDFEELAV
jgi:RecA/RadA recombinase